MREREREQENDNEEQEEEEAEEEEEDEHKKETIIITSVEVMLKYANPRRINPEFLSRNFSSLTTKQKLINHLNLTYHNIFLSVWCCSILSCLQITFPPLNLQQL